MTGAVLYPWLEKSWAQLVRSPDTLSHALLLTGAPGIGKRCIAEYLAQYLLCEMHGKRGTPCGQCDGCRWYLSGNHPDFRLLAPDEQSESEGDESKTRRKTPPIKVEAIRELAEFVNLTAHRRGAKVVLLDPAESMNANAANAFLKMLEEPPAGVTFILVSHHWRRLLPTVRSRCRVFPISTPDPRVASQWLGEQGVVNPVLHLAHTGGAPLAALDDANAEWLPQRTLFLDHIANPAGMNVLSVAAELEKAKLDTELVVDWLQKWVHDLIGVGLAGRIRYYPDRRDDLVRLQPRAVNLLGYIDRLRDSRRLANHPLNQRLVFESLLFAYLEALHGKAHGVKNG
ncbi:MAG: DNA polymerase III subunit delta' [Formivibrio sp.]|nr:DNA polymerase III subunit delta' [Formivibrio sp.]